MGQALVNVRIHAPLVSAEVEAPADTGATFTKVARSTIEMIGAETEYETAIELGDGRRVTRPLALADVVIDGVRRSVLDAVGNNEEQPLIGYTTLESLGFKANTVTHTLEPIPADRVLIGHLHIGKETSRRMNLTTRLEANAGQPQRQTMDQKKLLERIMVNPKIFGGKPIIRGRRLAVDHVLGMLVAGDTNDIILSDYPWLEPEDIQACLVYTR